MPSADDDPKKKKGQKAKPPQRKKDEKPPKPIKWAGPPGPEPKNTMQLLKEAEEEIQKNTFPESSKAGQSNPGIMPSIIKEVFFPPEAPQEVATLIESSLVYQNDANYDMAVRSLC